MQNLYEVNARKKIRCISKMAAMVSWSRFHPLEELTILRDFPKNRNSGSIIPKWRRLVGKIRRLNGKKNYKRQATTGRRLCSNRCTGQSGPLASGQSFPSFDVSPPGSDAYGLFKGISARFVASFRWAAQALPFECLFVFVLDTLHVKRKPEKEWIPRVLTLRCSGRSSGNTGSSY